MEIWPAKWDEREKVVAGRREKETEGGKHAGVLREPVGVLSLMERRRGDDQGIMIYS